MSSNYNYDPSRYGAPYQQPQTRPVMAGSLAQVMRLVYAKMSIALVVSGLVAWFFAGAHFLTNSIVMWGLIIASFALVWFISARINKLQPATGTLLLMVYAVMMGLMLSSIFLVFSLTSLAKTFFITAGTFAAMSIYGYTTKRDLSTMGRILFMALIGLIIASLVNLFLHSATMDYIVSIVGVLIFTGLTAWDTQQIKQMMMYNPGNAARISTIGALSLYLDFINLFLYLLQFFGASRD